MADRELTSRRREYSKLLEFLIAGSLVLFIVGLAFHLVIKTLIPGPIGTYWKELLLGLMILMWLGLTIRRREYLLSGTTLDIALLAFLGYIFLRLILGRFGIQAWWGFYYTVLYLPVFWIVFFILHKFPAWLDRFIWLIILLGSVVALGGIIEFILDRSLWPSAELIQRQGFPDVYIYSTHLRRVYFVFDSPTTLANTLALIFPLSLGMVYAASNTKTKLLAGIATLLMITCIGFTFSRGIWVASIIGLVIFGLLIGFFQHNKLLTFGLVGLVFVSLLIWIGITALRTTRLPIQNSGLRELSSEEYIKAPIVSVDQDLFQGKPANGDAVFQGWTIFDPIQNQNDQRAVLYLPALNKVENEVTYQVLVPEKGALKFAIALSPEVWSPDKGDGVEFIVRISMTGSTKNDQVLFNRYINPKLNPSDRRWRNYLLDMSPWTGKEINLSFITESGPAQNWNFDWSGWADLSIVSMPVGYFTSTPAQGDNLILQYIRSISNWVSDETNLDRLAAWNLSLTKWRESPFWGTGLGSTGLAEFRINPTSAFVTESQVLKVLTELGIPGILLFAFIWYTIARIGIQTLHSTVNLKNRAILFGVLTSLVIIFIEGWVYQNLEAKQVNALFWSLTGVLAYLSTAQNV